MTRAFDKAAANSPDLFEGLVNKIITFDKLQIQKVKVKEIRRAVVLGHYSGVMPDACQEAFGAFSDNGGLVSAIAYGPGGNSATFNAIIPGCNSKTARELIRVWVHPDAPTNTASFVISKTIKMLPPEVELIVTFADSGQNHQGTIYQALNFKYLGMSQSGIRYVDESGVEVTARLANVYKMRQPERFSNKSLSEIRNELGWSTVVSHPKHRYALGVGIRKKKINKLLNKIELPYPKGN